MRHEDMSAGGNGGYGSGAAQHHPHQDHPQYIPDPDPEGLTLRDYMAVLWRRKWVIALVVVVATASAYAFSAMQTPQYEATADLIYERQLDVSNPLTGQSYTDPNERNLELNSVGSVLGSPDMEKRAVAILEQSGVVDVEYDIEAAPVTDTGSGTTSTSSNVVRITVTSENAKLSTAAANAYADAYVDWRRQRVQNQIQQAADAVREQLNDYQGAAKQSTDYLVLQQRLQDLQILFGTATGNFRVLVPATVPEEPVSPKPLRSALLGFGVGLFAAIGLAFLLEQFDTRLRRPDEIAQALRQPILGRVPRISNKLLHESPLVTLKHPDDQVSEAFRMVRTNLDFMAVDSDVRSIAVTSCVQGEGKSVALANLAVTMALAGKKVVVVDADLRRPKQHKYFDVPNEAGVSSVAAGRAGLTESLVPVEVLGQGGQAGHDFAAWAAGGDARSRLYVLPSGPIPPNPGEIVASKRFSAIIETLEKEADLVLVDTPAMLAVGDTSAIAAKVDGLVFLVDMKVVKRPQLLTAADQLMRLPVKSLGIMLRLENAHGSRYYYAPGYYQYQYSYTQDGDRRRSGRSNGNGNGLRRGMPKRRSADQVQD